MRADVRGRYEVGPLRLRLTDPFGLCELTRSFTERRPAHRDPAGRARCRRSGSAGEYAGTGDSRARSVAVHGEDDAATREYRHGDDLRRVHWRSTARIGELMVRREEQPWESRATRAARHPGRRAPRRGPDGQLRVGGLGRRQHRACTCAPAGYKLRLVTDAGAGRRRRPSDRRAACCSTTWPRCRPPATARWTRPPVRLRGAEGLGTLIAVVGILDPEQAALLASTRSPSEISIAVLVDANSWLGLSPRARSESDAAYDASVEVLMRAGWRVVRARHGDRLPELWPTAGQRPGGVALAAPPCRGRTWTGAWPGEDQRRG